ncbi:MAG: O-antigen ligase family protein [Thermoflexales bacterium]|nr:O-antigen ligase family protein [Thermoflexales bacterium]
MFVATLDKIASWIARRELWFLAAAAPLMVFPWGPLPFLALAMLGLAWLGRWRANGRLTVATPANAPAAIVAVMTLVGYAVSAEPATSWAKLWGLGLGLAILYGLANSLRSERQVVAGGAFLACLTLGVAGLSLVGTDWRAVRIVELPWLYEHLPTLIRGLPGSGVPRATDLFHPREVGATMGLLLPAFVALMLFGQRWWLRGLSAVALAAGGLILLLSQSLQAMAGLGVVVLLLLAWRSRLWLLPAGLAAAMLAAGLAGAGLPRVAAYLLSLDNPVGIAVALRLDIWSRAAAMLADMPYTGIGLNTFPIIQPYFYPGYLLGVEPHAHNLYLQTALDLGLPGLAAFLWLLAACGLAGWRNYRAGRERDYRVLLLGLAAGIASHGVHGLFDVVALGAKPGAAMWAMLGMLAATPAIPKITPKTAERKVNPFAFLALSAVKKSSFFLFWAAWPLIALIRPLTFYTNLAAAQSHKGLYSAYTDGAVPEALLAEAESNWQRVVRLDPAHSHAYTMLGRIQGHLGHYEQALTAFAYQVILDDDDPYGRYYLPGSLLRRVRGEGLDHPWDDALQVYSQWMMRFPDRAEGYLQVGLVWERYKLDPAQARRVIEAGISQEAQPLGLLTYYLDYLGEK